MYFNYEEHIMHPEDHTVNINKILDNIEASLNNIIDQVATMELEKDNIEKSNSMRMDAIKKSYDTIKSNVSDYELYCSNITGFERINHIKLDGRELVEYPTEALAFVAPNKNVFYKVKINEEEYEILSIDSLSTGPKKIMTYDGDNKEDVLYIDGPIESAVITNIDTTVEIKILYGRAEYV